jgi:tetratricopeptide (TPR) repeat protein
VALAEEARPHLTGPEQGRWLDRLEIEHDNLRAALAWAGKRPGELGLQLAGALSRFWSARGHAREGRGWFEATLANDAQASPSLRARALHGAGLLAAYEGDVARSVTLYEEALAVRRSLGDARGTAALLSNLGISAAVQGNYGRAVTLEEEAQRLFQDLGDRYGVAHSLLILGMTAYMQGDYGHAAIVCEESLALYRAVGHTSGIAASLFHMGLISCIQGDDARGNALFDQGLALQRTLKEPLDVAWAFLNLGIVRYWRAEYAQAEELLKESLLLSRDIGAKDLVTQGSGCLAWVAVAHGQPQRAAQLGGAAEALREIIGVHLHPPERASHDQAVQTMLAALGEDAFAAAWAAGRALSLEAAIALALEDPFLPASSTHPKHLAPDPRP